MTTTFRRMAGWIGLAMLVSLPGMAAAKRQFVYVHDREDPGGIYAWEMDKNGGLTSIEGSPFALVDPGGGCAGNCETMAYSPKRKTLYTGGPLGVSAWTVNSDGTLTSVTGSPFSPGGTAADFLGTGVVQAGKRVFVYSSSFADDSVYGWEANSDGSLVELAASPFPSGDGPDGLATRKKLVFVANENDGSLSSYVADKDGTLVPSPSSPFFPPNASFMYTVSPDVKGKVLYVDDDNIDLGSFAIRAFAVDKKTAALTELEGSPFAAVLGGAGVLVTKKLAFAIGIEDPSNAFQPFSIVKKGALEATGIQGNAPLSIDTFATDKNGKRMVFAGFDGVATATIDDKKQGSLTGLDLEGFVTTTNPNAVVMLKR